MSYYLRRYSRSICGSSQLPHRDIHHRRDTLVHMLLALEIFFLCLLALAGVLIFGSIAVVLAGLFKGQK